MEQPVNHNAVNATAAAGPINAGNSFCRIALNIATVYAIQEPLHVKTRCSAENAGIAGNRANNRPVLNALLTFRHVQKEASRKPLKRSRRYDR